MMTEVDVGVPPISVYVHLPFCARKCHYCDFNSRAAPEAERQAYLEAISVEIERRAEGLGGSHVHTIFFGGGTPTIHEADELAGLLQTLRAGFPSTAPPRPGKGARADREVTCEANPETVDPSKLMGLREAGFNRLSIGAQSFDTSELRLLGRGHTSAQTADAVRAARDAGFENVSLDLIYALPGQTVEGWRRTLGLALALAPDHLSAYGLEVAAETPLCERLQAGLIELCPESAHLGMREATRELCEEAGLRRYEISNYSRAGSECRHNLTYWRNEPYLGLGAGAWSYIDGVRSANIREPEAYIEAIRAGCDPCEFQETLGPDDTLAETVMMGLRMTEGLSLEELRKRFDTAKIDELIANADPLERLGLVDLTDGYLRLTERGELLHSEVCVRLV